MDLVIISQLLLDFGLVVLIWIVQLIVYPSFLYYKNEGLQNWHTIYTQRIAMVVVPLMFGQLGITLFKSVTRPNSHTIVATILVLLMWVLTFTIFVPLHGRIASNNYKVSDLKRLIHYNWFRTVGWTLLFAFNLLMFFS